MEQWSREIANQTSNSQAYYQAEVIVEGKMADIIRHEDTVSEAEWRDFLAEGELTIKEECGFKILTRLRKAEGGIVNKASIYDTEHGKVFIKYSSRQNALGMFESEREGLKKIHQTHAIKAPKPIKVVPHASQGAMFIMEYMDNLKPVTTKWSELGTKIARLHKDNLDRLEKATQKASSVHKSEDDVAPVDKFGFHCRTHYGPHFVTEPDWCDTWQEYLSRHLLGPQFDQIEAKTGDHEFGEVWSELQLVLDVPYRKHSLQPSLTHGDFCSINVGETNGEAVTFDPCAVYAPSETDLTILQMEDDFHQTFYDSYHKVLPKTPGFDLRMKAQLAFASTLIYNIPGYEHTRTEALDAVKRLLKDIRHQLSRHS